MTRHLGSLAAVATMLFTVPSYAYANPTAPEEMKTVQYLVGTWNCAHTVGDFSGTYTTTFANALGNSWLKQTYEFPATKTDPAWHGESFLGYDERRQLWVRFFATSRGEYWGMVSKATSDTSWPWEYVLPGPSRPGLTTWTKKSDSEFAQDGPEYAVNGKTVTEHHTCKKA
jgi:hypothetical protein